MTMFGKSSKCTSSGSGQNVSDRAGSIGHYAHTQHALPRDDDLLGLLFDGQGANQGGDFFGGLPLCQLSETLLPRPYARVNDLEEKLSRSRVEDEDGTVCVYC